MSRQTFTLDGVTYCGTLQVTPPLIQCLDATIGACSNPVPPGRITRGTLGYIVGGILKNINNCDLTDWSQSWGRSVNAQGQTVGVSPWPAVNGATIQWHVPATGYIAVPIVIDAHTSTAAHFFKPNVYGSHAGDLLGVMMSLSQTPGDFSVHAPYLAKDIVNNNNACMSYRAGPGTNYYAGLYPYGTWYWNFMSQDGLAHAPTFTHY